MKKKPFKFKDIISDSWKISKQVNYRIIYFSFIVLAMIGVGSMALSLYNYSTFLIPFLFAALCLCISPAMEVYASSHLKNTAHFSLTHGCISTTYGYYHLIFSFVKAYVFGTFLASIVWAIIVGFSSINSPDIIDEIESIFATMSSSTPADGLEIYLSELAKNLMITLNSLEVSFLFLGFFISNRKNELSNAYSSAYLNDDPRFFLFNPLRKQIFNQIYRRFKMSYRLETWWSTIIGIILFLGGGALGLYLGLVISDTVKTINPYYFGAGLGIVFYAAWYGFERVVDSVYVFHHKGENEATIPVFIQAQMESVKAIYKTGFPNGRFDGHSFPEVNYSGNIRSNFNEETLKKFFFLYYSDSIIEANVATELPPETYYADLGFQPGKTEEEPEESGSPLVGIYGLDDFSSDNPDSDKEK